MPARLWAWLQAAAAAADAGYRRRRHRGRPDQGRDGDRQGARGARLRQIPRAARCPGHHADSVILWLVGFYLRPDYWALLPNSFAILLNYTEVALISVGLTYVIAAGDIDLSVGAVLALAGGAAAYSLKVLGLDPGIAMLIGLAVGLLAGVVNGVLTVALGLPAFIATLGMFYIARGAASWIVAGQQLTGFREQYNLIGRKIGDILSYFSIARPGGLLGALADVVSVQTLVDAARRRHRRHRARLYALRPEALRHRRQPPRRRLRRHQHQPRPFHRACSSAPSAPRWRVSSTSPISAASTRSPASSASSTASPR